MNRLKLGWASVLLSVETVEPLLIFFVILLIRKQTRKIRSHAINVKKTIFLLLVRNAGGLRGSIISCLGSPMNAHARIGLLMCFVTGAIIYWHCQQTGIMKRLKLSVKVVKMNLGLRYVHPVDLVSIILVPIQQVCISVQTRNALNQGQENKISLIPMASAPNK